MPAKKIVGLTEPAGERVEPAAEATLSGSDPIVRVNVIEVSEVATVTSLSEESALAGVKDQLPDASATTPFLTPPIVTSTLLPAVVIPENVG